MNQFTEFEMPEDVPKATSDEIRSQFPLMSAEIDGFRSVFGKVDVHMVEEGGSRIETKAYKKHLTYSVCSVDQFIRMGKLGRENSEYVNRDRNGRK